MAIIFIGYLENMGKSTINDPWEGAGRNMMQFAASVWVCLILGQPKIQLFINYFHSEITNHRLLECL